MSFNRGYFVVLGAFIINLTLGHFLSYGNVHPYIKLYMENYSKDKNLSSGNIVWIYGLMTFGMSTAISFGGYLQDKIGPTYTVSIGGLLMSANIISVKWIIDSYLPAMAFCYGLLSGLGIGLCYGVTLGVPCKWFPKRKGLVLGIILSGYALSAVIFNVVQMAFIGVFGNFTFDNKCINSTKIQDLPDSFLVLGSAYVILILGGALLLNFKLDENHSSIQNSENIHLTLKSVEAQFRPHQILLELDFWVLWFTFLLNTSASVLIMVFQKSYGFKRGITEPFLTIIGMCTPVFNSMGRIFWGLMYDRFSYKRVMISLTVFSAIFIGTFNIEISDPTWQQIKYGVWLCILNFLFGGNLVIFPSVCGRLFGLSHLIENYGILYTSSSIGSVLISILTTTIWSMVDEEKWAMQLSFYIGCGLFGIAFCLTLTFRGKSLLRHNSRDNFL